MASKQTTSTILMFPWLAHGHVFPFLELAKKLSKTNFHVYFCSTPINLDSITKKDDIFIELVELNLPSLPNLPPHYHTTKNIPPHLFPTLMEAFHMSRSNFYDIITNLKPNLLIYDGFQPWAAKIASSLGIPSVLFSTSGSTPMSFFHHMYTHMGFDSYPFPAIRLNGHEIRDVVAAGESIKIEEMDEGFAFGTFKLSCEIVLIKSCRGIEAKYVDYLSTLCGKKIVPTGPLIGFNDDQENGDEEEIMNWLRGKKENSTIYVSFGSENYLSKEQIGEMAKGLEVSGVDFIWVVRSPVGSGTVVEEALPLGFIERVRERGKIVQGWAPQAKILAHASVGGFVSHCGWGSVLESVYFRVPVVCAPLKMDQPVNARFVVEAGVGVEVERDESVGFDGKGVAKAVKEVMEEEGGEGFRRKAREMSEEMKMEENEDIDGVVKELSRICIKK